MTAIRVAKYTHHRHGMRNKKISKAELALQLRQQIHNLRAHAYIQRRDRFVGDNELRPQRQSAGNPNPLPLAPVKLMRKALGRRLVQSNRTQQLRHPFAALLRALLLVNHQRFGNDLIHSHTRIERSEWILKNDLHVAPQRTHLAAIRRQQITPSVLNRS